MIPDRTKLLSLIAFPSPFPHHASRRKIRRCPFGWIAASGHFFFIFRAFESIASARTTTEAKQLITDAYHSVVDLADELGEEAATVTALFTFISITADGFELDCIAFGRQCPSLGETQFLLSTPPELPSDVVQQIHDQISQRFEGGSDGGIYWLQCQVVCLCIPFHLRLFEGCERHNRGRGIISPRRSSPGTIWTRFLSSTDGIIAIRTQEFSSPPIARSLVLFTPTFRVSSVPQSLHPHLAFRVLVEAAHPYLAEAGDRASNLSGKTL